MAGAEETSTSIEKTAESQEIQELVERARQRDPVAFEKLVLLNRSRIFSLALRMMSNEAEAEELVQETFLSAWQNLPRFRGDSAFSSWVHRICANFALMRLRRQKLEPRRLEEGESLPEPKFDGNGALFSVPSYEWVRNPEKAALDEELGRAIEEATAKLPPDYRAVFLLRDHEGLAYEEIAQSLGLTVAAVKSRLHRARLALRESITAFYEVRQKPKKGMRI